MWAEQKSIIVAIKNNCITVHNETYTIDRVEDLKRMTNSIYNNKQELIYHCKDVINKIVPRGTTEHIKDIYLQKALFKSECFKYEGKYDIGLINKYIQHEVNTSLNNIRMAHEEH